MHFAGNVVASLPLIGLTVLLSVFPAVAAHPSPAGRGNSLDSHHPQALHDMRSQAQHVHRLGRRGTTRCPAKLSGNAGSSSGGNNSGTSASASASASSGANNRQPLSGNPTSTSGVASASSSHSSSSAKVVKVSTKSAKVSTKSASASRVSVSVASAVPSSSTVGVNGAGLFGLSTSQCGSSGATKSVTSTTGPNGAQEFLNCGLYDSNGWTPPMVTVDQVSSMSLDTALQDPNSPFQACKPYLSIFDKYAQQTGLPSILIASIAMQESSCIASTMGDNGGAYGLMQITQDKCSSGVSCTDPDYNIKTGATYFKSRLEANNNNILLALGEYNGWYTGLTVAKATAIKSQCCECQNNLNYFQQMLNGWMQNVDGSTLGNWVMGC